MGGSSSTPEPQETHEDEVQLKNTIEEQFISPVGMFYFYKNKF